MPELPDIMVYLTALRNRLGNARLERIMIRSPFLLRSFDPPLDSIDGARITEISRMGKRLVFGFEGEAFLVLHLMIAGRLRWYDEPRTPAARIELAALRFDTGSLVITEAGTKHRASLTLVSGRSALEALDPGGVEPLSASYDEFSQAIRTSGHTLKRALTDPRIVSGVGNAYSDEILHTARLSPVRRCSALAEDDMRRLYDATVVTLTHWIETLRGEFGDRFPGAREITAFRPGFAVHGRFNEPCPICGAPVQRVVYAENEMNYCPGCQTGGRILADRSLSRLLRDEWPRTLDELEHGRS
ncbi:MAG: Fpg/Nei family DNA glycosylase [Phycisphaerales bacterium]